MSVKYVGYAAEVIHPIPYMEAVSLVNFAGRTCYRSHDADRMDLDSREKFIVNLIRNGHLSVLEHVSYTMNVKLDRGLLAEWTRHRTGSAYSVESTRYVNYEKKEVEFILPHDINGDDAIRLMDAIEDSFQAYTEMIRAGVKPQVARAILPQALAVNMVVTHNVRQWRHILHERLENDHAHPDMRRLMCKVYDALMSEGQVFFSDINRPLDM